MYRLFVYGSLGPGRPHEHVMQNIGGTWEAGLNGKLVSAGWGAKIGFPGLVIQEDQDEILRPCVYVKSLKVIGNS